MRISGIPLGIYAGHNLFHMSEKLSLIGMIGEGLENWQDSTDRIVEDITAAWLTVGTFLMGFIGAISKKHLGPYSSEGYWRGLVIGSGLRVAILFGRKRDPMRKSSIRWLALRVTASRA